MKKPKILSSCYVYKGFYDLKQDLLETRDGVSQPFTTVMLSNYAANILTQTKEGKWLLNREYRHPTGDYVLGNPGGRIEEGEDPFVGAQRELFEETGYWSDEIVQIGKCFPLPGLTHQIIYFFWAKNAYKKDIPSLDPLELIEIELKSDSELREEIQKGGHVDGMLLCSLWYKDHFSPSA